MYKVSSEQMVEYKMYLKDTVIQWQKTKCHFIALLFVPVRHSRTTSLIVRMIIFVHM